MTNIPDNNRPQFAAEDYERLAADNVLNGPVFIALRAAADLARECERLREQAKKRDAEMHKAVINEGHDDPWERAEAAERESVELREKVQVLREAADSHKCGYKRYSNIDAFKPCAICEALAATADSSPNAPVQAKAQNKARPKPAHTDVAAKLAEALRRYLITQTFSHPPHELVTLRQALASYDAAQAQREGEARKP